MSKELRVVVLGTLGQTPFAGIAWQAVHYLEGFRRLGHDVRTGWFSDRSASYLPARKPVITQETGFSNVLPTGKGLFAFQTMDDILAAIDTIESDYQQKCRAAMEIAAEYFAAEKVVATLLERAGLA